MPNWKIAEEQTDQEAAIRLLIANYDQLGLPYPLHSLMLAIRYFLHNHTLLICRDDKGNAAGAAGLGRGTEEDNYTDWSKVEIYTVFLLPEYRCTRLFLQGMREVVKWMEASGDVSSLAFYLQPGHTTSKLFRKFTRVEKAVERTCGTLELLTAELNELQDYLKVRK
ncbi:MAG: hypothetical protein J7639_32025 [Paenibacillaceae bacterium]|nr:hypothetical protein [Paenibacillaceae bacterium]